MLREYVRTHALRATYVRTYMRIATCYILGGAALRMHTRYVRTTYARSEGRLWCHLPVRSNYVLRTRMRYVRTYYVRTHAHVKCHVLRTYVQRAGCDATCRFEVTTYVRTYLLHTEVQSYTTHARATRTKAATTTTKATTTTAYTRTYYTIAARTYVRTYAQEARTSKKPGPLGSPGTQGGISCIFAAVVDFCTARHHREGIRHRHPLRESQQGLCQMR